LGQLQSKTVKVCRVLRTGGLKKTVVSNRRKCQDVPGQSLRMTIKHLLDFWYLHFDPMCGKKQTTWDTATEKKNTRDIVKQNALHLQASGGAGGTIGDNRGRYPVNPPFGMPKSNTVDLYLCISI
jgi:hypothetical protein